MYIYVCFVIKRGLKMDIDREIAQGVTALERISFCLDQLEKAKSFKKGISWNTDIVTSLTIEEIVGALVSAEQELKLIQNSYGYGTINER